MLKPTDAIKIDRMKAKAAREIDIQIERAIKECATGRVLVMIEMPVSQGGLGVFMVDGGLRHSGG